MSKAGIMYSGSSHSRTQWCSCWRLLAATIFCSLQRQRIKVISLHHANHSSILVQRLNIGIIPDEISLQYIQTCKLWSSRTPWRNGNCSQLQPYKGGEVPLHVQHNKKKKNQRHYIHEHWQDENQWAENKKCLTVLFRRIIITFEQQSWISNSQKWWNMNKLVCPQYAF